MQTQLSHPRWDPMNKPAEEKNTVKPSRVTNINFLPITLIHMKRKGDEKEWNDPLGKMI